MKVGDKVLDVEGLIHTDKKNDLVILKVKAEKLPVVKLGDIAKAIKGKLGLVLELPDEIWYADTSTLMMQNFFLFEIERSMGIIS